MHRAWIRSAALTAPLGVGDAEAVGVVKHVKLSIEGQDETVRIKGKAMKWKRREGKRVFLEKDLLKDVDC